MKLAFLMALLSDMESSRAFTSAPRRLFRPITSCLAPFAAVSPKLTIHENAEDLMAQAAAMRLEAAEMDAALTLKKIAKLERQLNDTKWLEKNKGEEQRLLQLLKDLNAKVLALSSPPPVVSSREEREKSITVTEKRFGIAAAVLQNSTRAGGDVVAPVDVLEVETTDDRIKENPLEGFAPEDLELFLPVAMAIEQEMPNATVDEQLVKFRDEPVLQQRFQEKIQELVLNPMEEMQELENRRREYLSSSSSVEKDTIKRQIDRLEAKAHVSFSVSDSFYRGILPMSDEEMELRIANLEKLPKLLQALYMRRNGIVDETDLELGILIEHYDEQLQLLDQVKFVESLPASDREDAIRGYESLPGKVKTYFLKSIGLKDGTSADEVITGLTTGSFPSIAPMRILESSYAGFENRPEYNDIEFIERSQYVEELLPSITDLEEVLPTQEEIDYFTNEILEPKIYGLRSKPERVFGGYYIRGFNTIQGEGANDKLVERLLGKLAASKLLGKVQFFFIPDPKALTDEEIDMGEETEPVLLVTGVDPSLLYRHLYIGKKVGVSAAGVLTLLIFALGSGELNNAVVPPLGQAFQLENADDVIRISNNALPIFLALAGIHLVHEGAHRFVAWKDKFKVGPPNVVPSLQLGVTGTITPLESPPPNFNSLFDFALAGPLVGMAASLSLLIFGLSETASMGFSDQTLLPGLPAALVKSSALGGGLVTFFLGNSALNSPTPEFAVLPMHPYSVSGFVGLLTNAMALLPLGHTDGGRITLAMFGRRGAYLIKTFAGIALCFLGLVGLDESRILISYTAFVYLCQRELEAPMLNEVDQVDDGRAVIGFLTGLLVTLILLPMPH